ncbi:hypothetical protein TRIUR3_21052 [Triticum urartu]|uniref:Uncharacterized protein n=1 Tax=Triticum urartu TaxID=4572 RepID=M7ZSD7_TRIUA|nr:hypothetical protein TRIUR3_21052 [Triticum urartu]
MAATAAALMRMVLLVVLLVQMLSVMAVSARTLTGDAWLTDGIGMPFFGSMAALHTCHPVWGLM